MVPNQNASLADQAREYVVKAIVEPARRAGERTVTVRAGDVQRALRWWNRAPSVCSALDAREFQRVSRTRLIERRGPAQSTTAEWVLELSDNSGHAAPLASPPDSNGPTRRLVAVWDGETFRPVVAPRNLLAGDRVVLQVSPAKDARERAGRFARFVGTMSAEEAAEMMEIIERDCETISDDW